MPLDHHGRERSCDAQHRQLRGGGFPRRVVIHGKGAEQLAARIDHRRRPAGGEVVQPGEIFEVDPQWRVLDVGDHDHGAARGGGPARAHALAVLHAVDLRIVGIGQVRRGRDAQRLFHVVDEQNRAAHVGGQALDVKRKIIELRRQRRGRAHHFKQPGQGFQTLVHLRSRSTGSPFKHLETTSGYIALQQKIAANPGAAPKTFFSWQGWKKAVLVKLPLYLIGFALTTVAAAGPNWGYYQERFSFGGDDVAVDLGEEGFCVSGDGHGEKGN